MSRENNQNMLAAHPLAEHFPPVTGASFDRLRTAIRVAGQQEPIILHEGRILSGRARYKICLELQRKPLVADWVAAMGPPIEKMIGDNVKSRELSRNQRVAIAAGIVLPDCSHSIEKNLAHLAALFGVGADSIRAAQTILRHGTDREREQLVAGTLSLRPVADDIRRGVPADERARVIRLPTGRRVPVRSVVRPGLDSKRQGPALPAPAPNGAAVVAEPAPRRKPRILSASQAAPAPAKGNGADPTPPPYVALQQALWALIAGTATLDPEEARKHHVTAEHSDIERLSYWLIEYAEHLRRE